MSKKTRNRPARAVEGPNPKQPCPCGSGKRYKACHGAGDDVIVLRPFAGLTAEPDLVALREFVPSATAPLALAEPGERRVSLASVLPGAAAAMVRPNGEALVGMQVQTRGGDISTDLGRALRWALRADPGSVLPVAGPGLDAEAGAGPVRLQDLLVADAELPVSVHADFGWWLPEGEEPTTEGAAALEHANKAIMRTELLSAEGVRSAYWVDTGTKAHLRWVRPEPEDRLVGALARLAARDELHLGEGSRYAGSFRAHGLLVPVWDLDREPHVKEWAEPAQAFAKRLAEALARDTPLTDTERRARESLAGRQVTLR